MEEEYITVNAAEGAEILGISKNAFYTRARKGKITKIPQPNKERDALYKIPVPVKKVETRKKITSTRSENVLKDVVFRRANPKDAEEMYKLGEKIMSRTGGYGIKPEKLIPYLSIPNSEIGHVLAKNAEIVGYFTVVPLFHKQLMQRMRKEIYIADFPPNEIPMFPPDTPIDCFIWEMMSEPNEKTVGQYLINKMLKFFHTLGKRGVNIEGVYATASSIEGINLCRRMGMKLMNLPEVISPQYQPYELKIQENQNWLTSSYSLAFEAYKRRQNRLRKNATTILDLQPEKE